MTESQFPKSPTPHFPARAWLQLVRVPNLLTVPGDPIAGYLLAAGASAHFPSTLPHILAASVLFYAAGLIINDVVDVEIDRRERPKRPLPSGRVSAIAARNVAFLLMIVALGLCFIVGGRTITIGTVLCMAILSYNLWAKNSVLFGPLNMGLCRALNLVLGASLIGVAPPLLVGGSALLTAYVAMVTYIARKETTGRPAGWACWLPSIVVLAGMCYFVKVSSVTAEAQFRMTGAFFLAFAIASIAALRGPRPSSIGLMISALLFLQSAFCLASAAAMAGMICGLVLLALWPLNRLLSRWFYGS